MFDAARKVALLLVVALLFVPAAARAQQRLQPTGGASLTTFSKSAEGTRERADLNVGLAAVAVAAPAVILIVLPPDRPLEAVAVVASAEAAPGPLRAPPAL